MNWLPILQSLGTATILIGALAWLARTIITELLSKDLEKFKSEIQNAAQKNIEAYKNNLQIESEKRKVAFASLHAKRADIISGLYAKLSILFIQIRDLNRAQECFEEFNKENGIKSWTVLCSDAPLSEAELSQVSAINQNIEELSNYYSELKIYFSETICKEMDHFLNSSSLVLHCYESMGDPKFNDNREMRVSNEKMWDHIKTDIHSIQNSLENEFRLLLGVIDNPA